MPCNCSAEFQPTLFIPYHNASWWGFSPYRNFLINGYEEELLLEFKNDIKPEVELAKVEENIIDQDDLKEKDKLEEEDKNDIIKQVY